MKRLIEAAKSNAISLSVVLAEGPVAFADNTAEATMDSTVKSILNVLLTVFRYVGILLLAWGIVQVVLGFRNEDSDSKIRGIMTAIVAIVLIFLKTIINGILQNAGASAVTESSVTTSSVTAPSAG